MRYMDANTSNTLTGSRTGEGITAYVWYNGWLVYPDPLPISQWAADWDVSRQVQTLSLTVDDKDGRLAPWLYDDPLGVGGNELQVTYQVGGAGTVNMGWYRIDGAQPAEAWRTYIIDDLGHVNPDSPIPPNKREVMVSGGASISITASDRGVNAAHSRLLAPDSPQGTSPTIVSEVTRLMDGIASVVVMPGVTDRGVNNSLIYQQDRLNAVQDLCKRITSDYRFNGNGQLEIYPLTPQTPVWTLAGGTGGVLVGVARAQKLDGMYNAFVADGTATLNGQQVPIRGIARIDAGPLRASGPHGNYPLFYSSTMLTTQADCDAYAVTMRDTQIAGMTTDLAVECLPNPGLQQGDWVTVVAPTTANRGVSLVGMVTTMGLRGAAAVERMTLTIRCNYLDVQTVMGGVVRG